MFMLPFCCGEDSRSPSDSTGCVISQGMFHFISFDLISFQGTNLSEGRGTTLPFQLVSATALLSEAPACVPAFLPTWLAALLHSLPPECWPACLVPCLPSGPPQFVIQLCVHVVSLLLCLPGRLPAWLEAHLTSIEQTCAPFRFCTGGALC